MNRNTSMSCFWPVTTHHKVVIRQIMNMKIDFICETCGISGSRSYSQDRVPSHFFCSIECQNKWQKTREDIVLKNKDPKFREKVSLGLKHRKQQLGNNYHSKEAKRKIGEATIKHWGEYDEAIKKRIIRTLQTNAQNRRTNGPYDYEWQKISEELRRVSGCSRCGRTDHLCVHHIIPVNAFGDRDSSNLVVLCDSCHAIVDQQQKKIMNIIGDWEIVHLLVCERLGKII